MYILSPIAESQCCTDEVGGWHGNVHTFSYSIVLVLCGQRMQKAWTCTYFLLQQSPSVVRMNLADVMEMYILSPIVQSWCYADRVCRRTGHVHTFSYSLVLVFQGQRRQQASTCTYFLLQQSPSVVRMKLVDGLEMYVLSPIVLPGQKRQKAWTCTYFLLQSSPSVSWREAAEGLNMYILSPIADSYCFTGRVGRLTTCTIRCLYCRVVREFSKGSYKQQV